MKAGKRTAFIELFASTETTGDGGDPRPSWATTPTHSMWARKRQLTQREAVITGALESQETCVFEVKYVDGITARHRIKYGDLYFDITGINDLDERHKEMHIYARGGVSYGS